MLTKNYSKNYFKNLTYDIIVTVTPSIIEERRKGYTQAGAFPNNALKKALFKGGKEGKLRLKSGDMIFGKALDFMVEEGYAYKLKWKDILKNCMDTCYPEKNNNCTRTVMSCFRKSGECKVYSPRLREDLLKKNSWKNIYVTVPTELSYEILDEHIKANIKDIKDVCNNIAEKGSEMFLSLYDRD